jgi:hypothetical protein
MKTCLLILLAACALAQSNVIQSVRAPRDAELTPDPNSAFWRDVPGVVADKERDARPLPGHRTEIRSRWTGTNLYLLFISQFEQLYTKPNPDSANETNQLWNWDVAEAFIGSDFQNIKRYKEFEVSPHGEWVDLDIDRGSPRTEGGWKWNSGFKVATRIEGHVWYAVMQIPWTSIDSRPVKPGLELRANFYRMEGPPPDRLGITWQPTHSATFHIPEAFGTLRLVEK